MIPTMSRLCGIQFVVASLIATASVAQGQSANACPATFPAAGRAVLTPLADSARHKRFSGIRIDKIDIAHVRPLRDSTDGSVCLKLINRLHTLPEFRTGLRRVAFFKADNVYMVASIAADSTPASLKHRSIAYYFDDQLRLLGGVSSR